MSIAPFTDASLRLKLMLSKLGIKSASPPSVVYTRAGSTITITMTNLKGSAGQGDYVVTLPGQMVSLISDGSSWYVV